MACGVNLLHLCMFIYTGVTLNSLLNSVDVELHTDLCIKTLGLPMLCISFSDSQRIKPLVQKSG